MADATTSTVDVTEDVAVDGVAVSDGSEETDVEQADSSVAGLDFAVSRVVARLQRLDTEPDVDDDVGTDAVAEGNQEDEAGPRDWLRLLLLVLNEDGPVSVAAEPPEPSLLAVAVAAWTARLEPTIRARVQRRIVTDVTRWLARLCRCVDASCVLSSGEVAALAAVLRRLLRAGVGDDAAGAPIIYAQAEHVGLGQRVCMQLSASARCVRVAGDGGRVDAVALERQVRTDASAGGRPLALIAAPGDTALPRLCAELGLWLHLRGSGLARRLLPHNDTPGGVHADSFSIPLAHWLSSPHLDHAVLHRPIGDDEEEPDEDLGPLIGWLPVWAELAARGTAALEARVLAALAQADDVAVQLANTSHLQLMAEEGGAEVVFRFAEGEDQQLDRLNTWLGQMLARDCPSAGVGCVLVAGRVWLRHCPLECRADARPWLPELHAQLEILAATASLSPTFRRLAAASDRLSLVDVPGWAGLGGVVYGADVQDPDQSDRLNAALVDKLRVTDSAFSLGETAEGRLCVRFAMVTHDTDVAELLSLVEATGQQVEDAARALTNMADIVKKGIEEATLELQKEAEQRVWQQGVLRQVPVVGSLLNWWSPAAGDATKGRRLDLAAGGVVTPTTHMPSQ